jgi:hypothetical protein
MTHTVIVAQRESNFRRAQDMFHNPPEGLDFTTDPRIITDPCMQARIAGEAARLSVSVNCAMVTENRVYHNRENTLLRHEFANPTESRAANWWWRMTGTVWASQTSTVN